MSQQAAVTVIATIKQEEIQNLKQLLKSMNDNVASNDVIPFVRLSNVHFARLFVLDESVDLSGVRIVPSLVYMGKCDGRVERHLRELVDIAGEGLDKLYSCCLDYPASNERTAESRLTYLRSRLVKANAYYVNTIGRTVQQIQQEAQLRNAIQNFLDRSQQDWSGKNLLEIRAAIQAFVASEPGLRWARKPAAQPDLFFRLKETLHLIGVPLLLLVLLPLLVLALPVWLILLRIHELTDTAPHIRPEEAHIRELTALEDIVVQNQFSAVGYLKPGWFRRLTVLGVLWLVSYSARHIFNKGSLVGVKTIHFARWVAINEDRRMIFASNYDGALESYIEGLSPTTSPMHTIRAGEFILGYPNEYGLYTDRPIVAPTADPEKLLPRDASGSGNLDLGRNGSYLVFRQLRQDVRGFWQFLDQATRDMDGSSNPNACVKLASQMIGRWPSGAPLLKTPDQDHPEEADGNEFGYYQTDARGFNCPLGAHIRRANPRDSLDPEPGSAQSIAIGKRHRLLRRGREYGNPPQETLSNGKEQTAGNHEDYDEQDQGLHFLCLNANIARQFEFIQHTWVNNPKFDGLYDDADPVIGDHSSNRGTFTLQARPVRKRLTGLPRFVTVLGGAYFFLPGLKALRYLASLGR